MRFWEVERAVEAWYRRLGILAPPVDLDRLCDDCDVVVVRAPYPHLALPESGVILLDSSETDALRQRWRHAHELAHILRDVGGQMYAQSSGVIAVGLALWVFSQQATGDARKIFN